MNKKGGPYVLLGILLIVIVFAGGVKYGTKVGETNKVIKVLLSLTPTLQPSPTSPAPLKFTTYVHKQCGVSFLYPSTISKSKESSNSAQFVGNLKKPVIELDCSRESAFESILKSPKPATAEITLAGQTVKSRVVKSGAGEDYIVKIQQPVSGTYLYLKIEKSLLPLIESSLQLIRPVPR